MSRLAPLEAQHREAWDRLVATHPAGGFMQSWAWARFKELEGYRVVRLGIFEGDRLAGGALAYAFPSPAEAALLAVPDGPLLDWDAPAAGETLGALVRALRRSAAGRRAVAVRVEPRLPAGPAPESLPAPLRGLARAPVDLVPDETLEIDLGPEAEMLARMKPKGRYNARLAGRHGVEVTSSSDPADVHQLYFVLAETAHYHDFRLEPKSFFINLARATMPGMGRFAFARYKGITLAAALTVRHGATVTYLYGGHLPLFPEVMASHALHWHAIREAAREGYRVYDFYGYAPPDCPGHPYARFSRFKEKFGGRHVRRVGSRDVVFYDRLADVALRALRSASTTRATWTKVSEGS
ncbi:MAG: peptidoglycan bridge formation glycyltransferase FemA/FemB family protein [Candidatus Rokubacteria bacterium]|nr:peptidoglycan bridge formation glycyltransferase FemA/FemB family protein [Candidatus Rokubacteria bacterium]